MTQATVIKTPLLVRFQEAIETMDGRTLELHRDDRGGYWIVERRHGRSRTMPLAEYAWQSHAAARMLRAAQFEAMAVATRRVLANAVHAVRESGWLRNLAASARRMVGSGAA